MKNTKIYELEYQAIKIIIDSGPEGVLQSNLWRKLDATSREGSKVALKLEKRGIVTREKELFEGRWTYRLTAKKKPITIESIVECPCFSCKYLDRCEKRGELSPDHCELLTNWILEDENEKEVERTP